MTLVDCPLPTLTKIYSLERIRHMHQRKISNKRTSFLQSADHFWVQSCTTCETRFIYDRPTPLTSEYPVKAWPIVGTLNLFGGTQARGNLLRHLLFSSPEILNLEMPGVLKGLSCGFHILPALLWALLRVLTDWGGQVNSGRTRMTLFL